MLSNLYNTYDMYSFSDIQSHYTTPNARAMHLFQFNKYNIIFVQDTRTNYCMHQTITIGRAIKRNIVILIND